MPEKPQSRPQTPVSPANVQKGLSSGNLASTLNQPSAPASTGSSSGTNSGTGSTPSNSGGAKGR